MAKTKNTPKIRLQSAVPSTSPRNRRASQRARGIELQLGYPGKLRPLMIEQSRTEVGGYIITVYAGVRGEFLSAGVPSEFLPAAGSVEFEIRPLGHQYGHNENLLRTVMTALGVDRYELEINWGEVVPRDSGHPAICELARMMLKDLGYWYEDFSLSSPDLEQPIRELLADKRAEDFRPSKDAPRLQISADFRTRLSEIAWHAYEQVHRYGEVFPVPTQAKKVEPEREGSRMRLVVDNDSA
jgi:hypothetical protein